MFAVWLSCVVASVHPVVTKRVLLECIEVYALSRGTAATEPAHDNRRCDGSTPVACPRREPRFKAAKSRCFASARRLPGFTPEGRDSRGCANAESPAAAGGGRAWQGARAERSNGALPSPPGFAGARRVTGDRRIETGPGATQSLRARSRFGAPVPLLRRIVWNRVGSPVTCQAMRDAGAWILPISRIDRKPFAKDGS